MNLIALPDVRAWSGADRRFLTGDEKRELQQGGRPFVVWDAQTDFGPELDVALVVAWYSDPGTIVGLWTRHPSASRLRLAHLAQEAHQAGNQLGPVCCELIPPTRPDRQAFPSVVAWKPPAEVHGGGGGDFGAGDSA
jgi:hypothetical protein